MQDDPIIPITDTENPYLDVEDWKVALQPTKKTPKRLSRLGFTLSNSNGA